MLRLQSLLGLVVITGVVWACSWNRKQIQWRTVISGLGLQIGLCLLFFKLPFMRTIFEWLNNLVLILEESTQAGTSFVFGYLGGGQTPFDLTHPENAFVFAFRALPMVVLISGLSSVLFYWRILPEIVKAMSVVLQKAMGVGGAETLSVAANVFVGMVEAPLFIRPYLHHFKASEMFVTMVAGMAGVAGTVMALYAGFLRNLVPDALGHILAASIISAPAAIMLSKILIPQDQEPVGSHEITLPPCHGTMEALTIGITDGISLFINIVFMLVVFIGLVHIINMLLALLPWLGGAPLTMERILGLGLAPLAWLLGIPWAEAGPAGAMLGTKTVLNELLAYLQLAKVDPAAFSERSRIIMTYALCGFANFGSLGIMIGGLGAMCPEQRSLVIKLGFRSIVIGALATCMTGAVVGLIW